MYQTPGGHVGCRALFQPKNEPRTKVIPNMTDESNEKKPQRKKSRGHGEGSVYQRTNGSWAATITIGSDTNGKRIRKTVYGQTKKEVTDKLTRLQNQKLDGTLVDSGKLTVSDLLDRFLEDCSRLNTEPNTHAKYESISRIHLKPAIGTVKLSKLMPINIQTMLSKMEREKVGARTRLYVFATIRRALNVGLRWGLVIRNVCDCVDPPKRQKCHITTLSEKQVSDLLTETDGTRWHAMFMLAITTGLRQGELLGLQWADISLENATLSVRRSLEEVKKKLRLKEPKSASGRRTVTLPGNTVAALWQHKAILLKEGLSKCEMVFTDEAGELVRKWYLESRVWRPFRKAAKIPETITFHDLRHTMATMLLLAQIHPKVVQERLGHASIQQTMDTYSHVLPSMQQDAATKFDNIRLNIAKIG